MKVWYFPKMIFGVTIEDLYKRVTAGTRLCILLYDVYNVVYCMYFYLFSTYYSLFPLDANLGENSFFGMSVISHKHVPTRVVGFKG